MSTTTIELDHLDHLAAESFDGYIVRKDLVRQFARQYPVPTYVVEFLLGRYCASTDPGDRVAGATGPIAPPRPLPSDANQCCPAGMEKALR